MFGSLLWWGRVERQEKGLLSLLHMLMGPEDGQAVLLSELKHTHTGA